MGRDQVRLSDPGARRFCAPLVRGTGGRPCAGWSPRRQSGWRRTMSPVIEQIQLKVVSVFVYFVLWILFWHVLCYLFVSQPSTPAASDDFCFRWWIYCG